MKSWDPVFKNQLLLAPSYRDFLKLFFNREKAARNPKKISYAEFALRSNFASKSYMNDVIAGRKRLTPGAFDKVVLGLGLTATWADYLKSLAALEEDEFCSVKKDRAYYQNQVLKLKKQILRSLSSKEIPSQDRQAQKVFLTPEFPQIYASLGDVGIGESLEGILKKSRLPEKQVSQALNELESIGILRFDSKNQRYIPLSVSIEAYGLKSSDFFKNDFFRAMDKAKSRFKTQANTQEALFMTQSFSLDSRQLTLLRAQLAQVIESFAAQSETAEGDCIAEICISLTHNSDQKPL